MGEHRRVILKLSGEALAGETRFGFDEAKVRSVAMEVLPAVREGVELAVVIGGGNFWRGRSSRNIDRSKADQIGMLATVMNALYVSEIFRSCGMRTEIFTPFACGGMTRLFSEDAAKEALSAGRVVFFAGGTGHPYFSTDTGIVLRALELEMDEILLAKAVDGVYDSDPAKNPNAKKYDTISIDEVVEKKLGVIDLTASALCLDNRMPLAIFALDGCGSITRALRGEISGTRITV
ncbi:MAG: UMP kinase [Lachnospiraceae bacterium]|nr:UMP kinase [Lachnospiraceae bacterium]